MKDFSLIDPNNDLNRPIGYFDDPLVTLLFLLVTFGLISALNDLTDPITVMLAPLVTLMNLLLPLMAYK